jgi:hypothetical protein
MWYGEGTGKRGASISTWGRYVRFKPPSHKAAGALSLQVLLCRTIGVIYLGQQTLGYVSCCRAAEIDDRGAGLIARFFIERQIGWLIIVVIEIRNG